MDFAADEENFKKIAAAFENCPNTVCEFTHYHSLRVFIDGAKMSVHSLSHTFPLGLRPSRDENAQIHGIDFNVVDLDTLIYLYIPKEEGPRKEDYQKKFLSLANIQAKSLKKKQFEGYTFFLLKPSVIKRKLTEKACHFIEEHGFLITNTQQVTLTKDDVDFLYDKEYKDLVPIITEDGAKTAIENAHRLYDNETAVFLIVKYNGNGDIFEAADALKGKNYWPAKCAAGTIRYEWREKEHDGFEIPNGKIVPTPCDNVVHVARNADDFFTVYTRWFA